MALVGLTTGKKFLNKNILIQLLLRYDFSLTIIKTTENYFDLALGGFRLRFRPFRLIGYISCSQLRPLLSRL